MIEFWINEPSIGWTDRTSYLWIGQGAPEISFSLQRGERGPAQIPLILSAANSYAPTLRTQCKLIDVTGQAFFGIISDYDYGWIGQDGYRHPTINAVTLKQCLDTLRIPPRAYSSEKSGDIVTDLLTTVASGLPIALGTISAGVTIDSVNYSYDLLSDAIQSLATTNGFIWDVDPTTNPPQFFFRLPNTVTSPVTVLTSDVLWESLDYSVRDAEFRDRQIIKLSFGAFAPSHELLTGNGHTTMYSLRNPVDHLVKATLTTSTRATGTGIYTGQPTAGDTVSVNNLTYTFVASLDNTQFGQVLIGASANATWQNFLDAINATMSLAGSTYSLPTWENSLCNIDSIDTANGQFQIYVKVPGSGGSNLPLAENCHNFTWYGGSQDTPGPPPDPLAGASPTTPIVFSQVAWGHIPAENDTFVLGGITYRFKHTPVANYDIGIDSSDAATVIQQVADCVNANSTEPLANYFPGTPANPLCRIGVVHIYGMASPIPGPYYGGFVPGYANVLAISPTPGTPTPAFPGTPISFIAVTPTAAGADDINAAGNLTGLSSPGTGTTPDPEASVQWVTGSNRIVVATAPAAGVSLSVSYYRLGADCIAVEDSTLVAARAAIEHGTGRVDQYVNDDQNTNAFDGLSKAQSLLSTFSVFPQTVQFETYTPGILPGDVLPFDLVKPLYATSFLNPGTWIVQEVRASYLRGESPGHQFKYTVTVISADQVQSDVQFMERLAQTGGSQLGSSGPAIAKSTGEGSGGGNTDNTNTPVEEVPIGPINGTNKRFTLTWVPRMFPLPSHQVVLLERNGVEQNPFGWGSPAVDPDFTIDTNVITYKVAPVVGDWHKALYWPDVGTPQRGALISLTANIDCAFVMDTSYPAFPFVQYNDGTHTANILDTFSSRPFTRAVFSATVTGADEGDIPTASVFINLTGSTFWDSTPGTGGTVTWYSVYLVATYANQDPDLPNITVYYYPTSQVVTPGSGVDLLTPGAIASGTDNRWHVSGLSTPSTITYSGFQQ